MDNAIMIGLSRQMTLKRSMDVVANNIANANTAGFKVESLLLESSPAQTASHSDGPSQLQYVSNWGMGRDFSQGALEYTGRDLDLAIEGDGFFSVIVDGEEQYTRDGRFHVDADGQLVVGDGAPVIDSVTRDTILIDPSQGALSFVDGGVIMQNGNEVGQVGVFQVTDLSKLSKQGNGRYTIETNGPLPEIPEVMPDAVVRQGYSESSNVKSIVELTNMMAVMRSYQSVSKFMNEAENLKKRTIERLGKV